ncbi:MAG: hypothetical protein ACI4Q3_02700 [Kiritimatiellia bacterium]
MEKWYVRNTAGKVFGPIELDVLKAWVKDGRVEPLAGISQDLKSWMLAPLKPELEMNWVVENNPGQFYGPTHRMVVDDLIKTGSLSDAARFYQDDRGATTARLKTLESAVAARDAAIVQRDSALAEAAKLAAKKDLQLASAQKAVARRDERISQSVAQLAQKDAQIEALNKTLQAKEGELVRKDEELRLRAEDLQRAIQEIQRRDADIQELKEQIATRAKIHEREWKSEVLVPEVVNETPPPVARQAFGFGVPPPPPGFAGGASPASLADLERRAQQELTRMGASDMKRLFRFKK